MNEQENNKANAAILLSADEAVEKKIIAVLLKNPQLIQNALDTIERERQALQAQQYQNALAQSMAQTKRELQAQMLRNTYQPGMAVSITEDRAQSSGGFLSSIFGSKT
jgi:hypothetical protein